MSKVIKYGALACVLIVLILILVPWLFKDQIFKQIQAEANKNLKGELTIEDLSLRLFSDFPNLTLTLEGLAFTCDSTFAGVQLFAIEQVRAELDLASVFTGEVIKIEQIRITKPEFNLLVTKEGIANYDILKYETPDQEAEDTAQAQSSFQIDLKRFDIRQLHLRYADAQYQTFVLLDGADLQLKGDFTQDVTDLTTHAEIGAVTVGYEGINYLNEATLKATATANYNSTTGRLTLADNAVWVNKLNLLFAGWIESTAEKMAMDITFSAPHTAFKEVLSMVPALYAQDFDDIQTAGRFSLQGTVQGDYYGDDTYPKFVVEADVRNGMFKYPELPSAISDINFALRLAHPGGTLNNLTVAVPAASMVVAGSPFNAHLDVKYPLTDPYIDLGVQTKLDLGKLLEIIPVEGTSLRGKLEIDAEVKGLTSDFEAANLNAVAAKGYIVTHDVFIQTDALTAPVAVDTLYAVITPTYIGVKPVRMQLGSSVISGSGELHNAVAYALTNGMLQGTFSVSAPAIDVTQLMSLLEDDSPDEATLVTDTHAVAQAFQVPDNLNIAITAKADTVIYDDIILHHVKGNVVLSNAKVLLKDARMDLYGGTVNVEGSYSTQNVRPQCDMALSLKNIDAAAAFQHLNTVQAFAPVAQAAVGAFGGTFRFSSFLDDAYMPDLASIDASGSLLTKALALQPEVMKKISALLQNPNLENVRFQDANLSFSIADGRVKVSPVKVLLGSVPAEFYGSHGLDQTLDYHLNTTLTVNKNQLPKALQDIPLTGGTIPVAIGITGTLSAPLIKPVFGTAVGVQQIIEETFAKAKEELKDTLIAQVNKEAEKILADARAQADAVLATARKEADRLRAEAKTQGDKLRAEARTQADKLVKEAKGDPLKELAAKTAANALIKKADEQIDSLLRTANQQADNVLAEAEREAAKILKEADEKAKIKTQ